MKSNGFTDALFVGISLLVTIGVVTLSVIITKTSKGQISRKVTRIESELQDVSLLKGNNEKVIKGATVINLIDLFSDFYPFMFITPETFNRSQTVFGSPMYSFDSVGALDPKSDEYINPTFEYYCTVFTNKYGDIECVRFVEREVMTKFSVVSFEDVKSEYKNAVNIQNSVNTLIEKQYELYSLEK